MIAIFDVQNQGVILEFQYFDHWIGRAVTATIRVRRWRIVEWHLDIEVS